MVEKDKIQKQIEEKKRKRHGGDKEENTTNSSSSQLESNDSQSLKKFKRHFKQIQPRKSNELNDHKKISSKLVKSVFQSTSTT